MTTQNTAQEKFRQDEIKDQNLEAARYRGQGLFSFSGVRLGNSGSGSAWLGTGDDGASLAARNAGGFAEDSYQRTMASRASDPAWLNDYRDQQIMAGVDPDLAPAFNGSIRGIGARPADGRASGPGLRLPGESSGVRLGWGALDTMGQPLDRRSNYNGFSKLADIVTSSHGERLSLGRLYDWATYTVPDAQQLGAEIRSKWTLEPNPDLARIDSMRASPLAGILGGASIAFGARPETQDMFVNIGSSLEGLALARAGLTGRVADLFGAQRPVSAFESPYALTSLRMDSAGLPSSLRTTELRFSYGVNSANLKVEATFEHQGRLFYDVNQTARNPELATDARLPIYSETRARLGQPNQTYAGAHAEIGSMWQSYESGARGGSATLTITGKDACTYCVSDVKKMALQLQLNELTVIQPSGTVRFVGPKDFAPVKLGGMKWGK